MLGRLFTQRTDLAAIRASEPKARGGSGTYAASLQRRQRTTVQRLAAASLIVGGILVSLVGLMLLLASLGAMGPENEVPLAMWLVPLMLGAVGR
jgi:hypothetical protein